MTRTAILCFDDCHASSLSGFADLLQVANAHLQQQGMAATQFKWDFVSSTGQVAAASNGLPIPTEKFGPRKRYELVFIPSLHYRGQRALDRFLAQQQLACDWLTAQRRHGAVLVANCTGTFLLAQTGLLDGRAATTTWWLEQQFRNRFPRVDLQLQRMLTEEDGLLCAGPAASYLLQAVRAVELFKGQGVAAQCAKSMLLDLTQTALTPYLPLLAGSEHGDALVQRAQRWLSRYMSREVRIAELAAELATSERTLIRRFKAALNITPLAYLQDLRLEAARALLEGADLRIEQIAAQVGYADTSSFARLFKQRVGVSPGQYRARFQLPR